MSDGPQAGRAEHVDAPPAADAGGMPLPADSVSPDPVSAPPPPPPAQIAERGSPPASGAMSGFEFTSKIHG